MSIDRYYDREFERDAAEADGLVDHLFEQSRKIVEAAGECWHKSYTEWTQCDDCTMVWRGVEVLDLSLPENRHILIWYVQKLCDTDEKWEKFEDYADESADWAFAQTGPSYRRWLVLLPNETIMSALCRVIEETK